MGPDASDCGKQGDQPEESRAYGAGPAQSVEEALRTMHGLVLDLAEENLRLHRQAAHALNALNRDLERVKTQLRRVGVART